MKHDKSGCGILAYLRLHTVYILQFIPAVELWKNSLAQVQSILLFHWVGNPWSVWCCWFPVCFHIHVGMLSLLAWIPFSFFLCSFATWIISIKHVIKVLQEILDSIFEPLASKSCTLKYLVSDFKWLVCSMTFIWSVSVSRCFLIGFVFFTILKTILQPSFWSFQDLCM